MTFTPRYLFARTWLAFEISKESLGSWLEYFIGYVRIPDVQKCFKDSKNLFLGYLKILITPLWWCVQVDLLFAFCQELGLTSVVLVGHADGGLLALMAAARALKFKDSIQVCDVYLNYLFCWDTAISLWWVEIQIGCSENNVKLCVCAVSLIVAICHSQCSTPSFMTSPNQAQAWEWSRSEDVVAPT